MSTQPESRDLRNSQLFLDDSRIEDHIRVQRVWHQPEKYPEPVMKGKYQWEADCPCLYGTVLRIDGLFRMWYVGTRNSSKPRVCYAESTNGIHWERPELGICEYRGSKQNNILLQPKYPNGFLDDCSMIYEPEEEWPFKLLYWDSMETNPRSWGIFAANSKDGIRFEEPVMILPAWDDRFIAVTDKVDGKYRIYGRGTFLSGMDSSGRWTDGKPFLTEYALPPFPTKRPVVYTESEDLAHWSHGEQLIKPDMADKPQMQIYDISPFRYEGAWLGTLLRMHTVPDLLDPEIIWSHDGKDWQRSLERQPFIPRGPKGSFDSVWLNLATNPPIYNYNQLWFYYSGRAGGHGGQFPGEYGAIGLATLRVDGFCSLQAGEAPGGVLTKPMTWVDSDLLLNVDPRRDITGHHTNDTTDGGRVRVEIRDEENHPIAGYRFEDSSAIVRNTRNFEETPAGRCRNATSSAFSRSPGRAGAQPGSWPAKGSACSSRSRMPTSTPSGPARGRDRSPTGSAQEQLATSKLKALSSLGRTSACCRRHPWARC